MAPEILAPVFIKEFWHLAHRLPRAELVAGHVIAMRYTRDEVLRGAPPLADLELTLQSLFAELD